MMPEPFDAVVIGAGEAGAVVASRAVAAGHRAAMIYRAPYRVTGSAGLSLTTGAHRLEIEGAAFRTWCAYDSIGIAAALAADAQIETECAVCGRIIRIRTDNGRPAADPYVRLWLATGGALLRGDFCEPTVLLCSPEHAAMWAERQEGRGRTLDLVEAATLGSAGWASCAATAEKVRAQPGIGPRT